MAQTQLRTPAKVGKPLRRPRKVRAPDALLKCPICALDVAVRAAELGDGQELRCTHCRSELVVARNYDVFTGKADWSLESPEDEYGDEQP